MDLENKEYRVTYITNRGTLARSTVMGWSEETAYLTFRSEKPYIKRRDILEVKRLEEKR